MKKKQKMPYHRATGIKDQTLDLELKTWVNFQPQEGMVFVVT